MDLGVGWRAKDVAGETDTGSGKNMEERDRIVGDRDGRNTMDREGGKYTHEIC